MSSQALIILGKAGGAANFQSDLLMPLTLMMIMFTAQKMAIGYVIWDLSATITKVTYQRGLSFDKCSYSITCHYNIHMISLLRLAELLCCNKLLLSKRKHSQKRLV